MIRFSTKTRLAAVLLLLVVGCAGTADVGEVRLIEDGKLIVCTNSPYPPFEYQDESGAFDGFDVDLMEEIASGLDLTLEWTITPFDRIWLQPAAGACDLVISAMTIKPERAEVALFSDPYFDSGQSLLVKRENQDWKLSDLAGRTIGVQTGTTGEAFAHANKPATADIRSYEAPAALFVALDDHEIDAILQDLPANLDRTLQDESVVISESFAAEEHYGIAASLENGALIDAINSELERLRDDGTYEEIHERWIGIAPSN